jgi:hypothetical protein
MGDWTTIAIGKEWRDRVKEMAAEKGMTQRETLEGLLSLGLLHRGNYEPDTESAATVTDGALEWVPVAEIVQARAEIAAEVERVLDEADEPEPVVEGDPMAIVAPVVTSTPGQRDFDPVATGCPACERGAPRKGALHNCGKPNPNLGEGRPGL